MARTGATLATRLERSARSTSRPANHECRTPPARRCSNWRPAELMVIPRPDRATPGPIATRDAQARPRLARSPHVRPSVSSSNRRRPGSVGAAVTSSVIRDSAGSKASEWGQRCRAKRRLARDPREGNTRCRRAVATIACSATTPSHGTTSIVVAMSHGVEQSGHSPIGARNKAPCRIIQTRSKGVKLCRKLVAVTL
jgi:hypothetical protein